MIKVSVFYLNGEGKTFDMDYYCNKHIPLVKVNTGDALKKVDVEQGLAGLAPGSKPDYIAAAHLYFDTMASFQSAFVPHIPVFNADIPRFTNITPVGQISEVKM